MLARCILPVAALVFSTTSTFAQVHLTETPKPGDTDRFTIELNVSGNLIVLQEGKRQEIKLTARSRHVLAEKTLAVADGMPSRSVRLYEDAAASVLIGSDKDDHSLPTDRRLFVAARTAEGLFCYCPAGPVTREELDLVSEHFDPHCLAGLLPGKAVGLGDTWPISNPAAHAACLFDGLVKHSLTGKLTAQKDGIAEFAITGTAEGIENGAKVNLVIEAAGKFHVESGRVVELVWKQTDDREQGPASPASKLDATVTLKREKLAQEPKEFVPPVAEPTPAATQLRFADPKGRYQFTCPREWHITGQTDEHLVLRLIDHGEFLAQATISAWRKADPGKHTTVEEFKKAIGESPGWKPSRVIEDGEVPLGGGRWLYRLIAEGKLEEQPAIQVFQLLAGPQGDQVAITLTLRPEKVKSLDSRDLHLIKAIELGKK